MTTTRAPRIPGGEAVGLLDVLHRLNRVEDEHGRVIADLQSNEREYRALAEREHELRSEYERLRWKAEQLSGRDAGELV
jgi:hypothetical protein